MRGRADDPHHMLQPDGHALHWRRATGEKLHHEENGGGEQSEQAHGCCDRAVLHRRAMLIVDEPTSVVDPVARADRRSASVLSTVFATVHGR